MSTRLRYNEYYDMQATFDWLYKCSLENKTFGINLYEIIASKNNILLAYRVIKSNTGSKTVGVDKCTISDYQVINQDDFISEIRQYLRNYTPNAVRRVDIPKQNGKTRPLGIPTMRDRLIQQMIKQVLEPICEAKFHKHSYGFRPNRSAHHAIARCNHLINANQCHFVVDIDIKGFFDNVNHRKLLHQLYTIGITDKRVLAIIAKMLKAPILKLGIQRKGTPQGAILSPLLSNVVLNNLDWWISNQWETFQTNHHYANPDSRYAGQRNTKLKEMFIVRYADDFKIFTKNYEWAQRIYYGVVNYLAKQLKLDVSQEKSKITNLRKRSSEFLGFEIKAMPKRNKYVAITHVSKKKQKIIKQEIKELIKKIQKNPTRLNVWRYNSYILGVHNYYKYATHVSNDFSKISFALLYLTYNRLKKLGKYEPPRSPPPSFTKQYKSRRKTFCIRGTYLYPISDIQWKLLINFRPRTNSYTEEGRKFIHKQIGTDVSKELYKLLKYTSKSNRQKYTMEYMDNRLSKYSMQNGKCAVTGNFVKAEYVHCHHILPKSLGGTDEFQNLVVVHEWIHILIHSQNTQTIAKYLTLLQLNGIQLKKLNKFRKKCNLTEIY